MELNKPDWIAQMEGVLETLNEGVLITDDCNVIVFANQVLLDMAGLRAADVLGRAPESFYEGPDREFLTRQVARGLEQGQNRFEFYVPRRDPSASPGTGSARIPVVISSRVIEDPEGRWFAIVTFTDVRELKQTEARLREAYAQLEQRQREIERELELAARVQQSLAPASLQWCRLAVESHYLPVRTIGGDFGLVAPAGDPSVSLGAAGRLNLLLCDVSGHGIGSALVANRIYAETISLLDRGTPLEEMLRVLNRFVLQHIGQQGFYFSLVAACFEDNGCGMRFASAGHPPALLLRGGAVQRLESRSRVLGLLDDAVGPQPVEEVKLLPGDRLVFYTDGLTDVFDSRDDLLGVDGFEQIVRRHAALPLERMKQAILEGVAAYRHGPATDDVSLVLVEAR